MHSDLEASPLGEVTTYAYDAEDHVTDVIVDPNGLKLHSSYTYDLIGEIASSVPPNGNVLGGNPNNFRTTWTRNATLTKITVTDPTPAHNTTVTDFNEMGGAIDFYDKRGIETTFRVDNFGRFSGAAFNANNVSGYLPFGVFPGPITSWPNALYDPLDRPYALTSWYTNGGIQYDTIAYTYDGVDNVLSEAETPGTYNFYTNTPGPTSPTLNFTYDENGRRTQLTSTLNGYSMPTINYGYDCADELVSMSNDGSQLPAVDPQPTSATQETPRPKPRTTTTWTAGWPTPSQTASRPFSVSTLTNAQSYRHFRPWAAVVPALLPLASARFLTAMIWTDG